MSRRKKKPFNRGREHIKHTTRPATAQETAPAQPPEAPAQDYGMVAHSHPDAANQPLPTQDADVMNGLVPYDDSLLDVCRTRWQFGDWAGLAALDPERLRHHPERGRIALLVASAHFQLGQTQLAHRLLQTALDWGASHRQAAQMLISGTHHSLAEAHWLLNQPEPSRENFLQAIRAGGVPGDAELLAQARLQSMQKHDVEESL